jgi:hypothetical protein
MASSSVASVASPSTPSLASARVRRRYSHRRAVLARAQAPNDVASLVTLDRALKQIADDRKKNTNAAALWIDVEGARVRLPRGRPWGFVHFVGGAVLGAYPEVAYDSWLSRVADACDVVVVATPFELGTDHEAIAKGVKAMYSRARVEVCAQEGLDVRAAPTFRVGHSLGCKVLTLLACEDEDANADVVDVDAASGAISMASSSKDDMTQGYFLVAFNNASASDSVMLIEKFARELLKNRASGGDNAAAFDFLKTLPSIASFAERAAKAAGFDFKPSPEDTLERVRRKFSAKKTRMLKFTDDELGMDQNEALVAALRARFEVYPGTVDTQEIEGNHLTPVFFTLEGMKLSPALERVVGDFSLGDAKGVNRLADALVSWIRER